jgi:hypothetical protein
MSSGLPQEVRWQFFKRSSVRDILQDIYAHGMPEDECDVTISFVTKYPGVILPAKTVADFPSVIRIALRYGYFWDLQVSYTEVAVDVMLSSRQRIVIPFASMVGFYSTYGKVQLEMDAISTEFAQKILPHGVLDCAKVCKGA